MWTAKSENVLFLVVSTSLVVFSKSPNTHWFIGKIRNGGRLTSRALLVHHGQDAMIYPYNFDLKAGNWRRPRNVSLFGGKTQLRRIKLVIALLSSSSNNSNQ